MASSDDIKTTLAKRSLERNDLLRKLDDMKRKAKGFSEHNQDLEQQLDFDKSILLRCKRLKLENHLKDVIINSFEDALCESEARIINLEKQLHFLEHGEMEINGMVPHGSSSDGTRHPDDSSVLEAVSSGIDRFLKLSSEVKRLSTLVAEKDSLLRQHKALCVCRTVLAKTDSSTQTESDGALHGESECVQVVQALSIGKGDGLSPQNNEFKGEVSISEEVGLYGDRRVDFIIALDCLRGRLTYLKAQHAELWAAATALPINMKVAMLGLRKTLLESMSLAFQKVALRSKQEYQLRRQMHNELMDLRGNIRVFCRIRPMLEGECEADNRCIFEDQQDDQIVQIFSKGDRSQLFTFDQVFGLESSQECVFKEVRPLIASCMDGYNVCIFAYGQTGSGKTFTMQGPKSDPGIYHRALATIFEEAEHRAPQWQYQVFISILEIYNDSVVDLLGSSEPDDLDSMGDEERLSLKLNADGSVKVHGAKVFQVDSLEELSACFAYGCGNRATAATAMNDRSSRSHCLLRVNVQGRNDVTCEATDAMLNLVDLAGSERVNKSGSTGERLKEAQSINRSLSALGDVMQALRNKHSHVPFRNSKLTFLLQDSLKGQSKALMMVQVAPTVTQLSESLSSLSFAQRVRTIQLGPAAANRYLSPSRCASPGANSRNASPFGGRRNKLENDSPLPGTPVPANRVVDQAKNSPLVSSRGNTPVTSKKIA